jgi:quinol monooxygenase YgiN
VSPSQTGPVTALLPGRVGLVVRLVAAAGARPALLDALNRYVDRLDEEPGTESFLVSLDPDDDAVVWLHEWFTDDDAQLAHRASAPFAQLLNEMPAHLADGPAVMRFAPLRLHLSGGLLAGDGTLEPAE